MGSIIGIPTTRVTDLFIRQRLMNQVQSDQIDLLRIQTQLSTGRRFELPSEDADAALRAMCLQRLLERKEQVQANLTTNQSYLAATETALSTLSNTVAEVRGEALTVLDNWLDDSQRDAVAQQVQQAIQQLVDVGNQQFRGRYLFAGTGTTVRPFATSGSGLIQYLGNEGRLSSYADIDLLFDTNLHGSEVFGAISEPVLGSEDLNPVLTCDTRLADLRGGRGITRGSIQVSVFDALSCTTISSTIDVCNAETIGDVAAMIRAGPPQGKALNVEISARGLVIELDGGPGDLMSIREVGDGTTASELGILTETGVDAPVVGEDLDPILRLTTRLRDILGTQSYVAVRSDGADNDLVFRARANGTTLEGTEIVFQNTGVEAVNYVAGTLTFDIIQGVTCAQDIIDMLEDDPAAAALFSAGLDRTDANLGDGSGKVAATDPMAPPQMAGGSGNVLDKTSGLQIVNDGETHTISFDGAETIEDMLNILNGSDAGVLAEINENATGINVRSRISGADFMIGENGGNTATQLGLRTFTESTRLEDLNYGRGVADHEGTDFIITRSDGVEIEIDVSGLETIGEVLDLINSLGGGTLGARPAAYGNGIELFDETPGSETLTVTRTTLSAAAISLGLIPEGQQSSTPTSGGTFAEATVVSAGANNDLIFTAVGPGNEVNDVDVIFQDTVPGPDTVNYDPDAGTLTFEITDGATTANQIIALLAADPFASTFFSAGLAPVDDGIPNDGNGFVENGATATMSGGSQTLTGADVNPLETDGIFTALLRLHTALRTGDTLGAQRAIELLDEAVVAMRFSRAELAARQQGLDTVQLRLDSEDVDLRTTLSEDFDADLVEVISDFTARQLALEASLRSTASILQMTLLDYL